MHMEWAPERFAATLTETRDAMGLGVADLARLAGVSRSQASRWGHGSHQPAYASVRRLAGAVRVRGHRDLADQLMTTAGYGPLPEGEIQPEPELLPEDKWETRVLSDPGLPYAERVQIIRIARKARADLYPAAAGPRPAGDARADRAPGSRTA